MISHLRTIVCIGIIKKQQKSNKKPTSYTLAGFIFSLILVMFFIIPIIQSEWHHIFLMMFKTDDIASMTPVD